MTLLMTVTLTFADIVKTDADHVLMTTSDYKILLKGAHEGEIRNADDQKPERGKIFVGAGIGYKTGMLIGGYLF
jgi:hypothetical protein